MPTISAFYGIMIQMFWADHAPPHFHALYGEYEALINVKTLEVMQGRSENAGVFAALRDETVFRRVFLEYGAVTWPGEIDLAPDAMYEEIKKNGVWLLS
jgi:hypothetical protein